MLKRFLVIASVGFLIACGGKEDKKAAQPNTSAQKPAEKPAEKPADKKVEEKKDEEP